jgi:DNA-binding MarR family transcriptional regulator/predicted GNAT family acetyltransferase
MIIHESGNLMLGSRLKRLGERALAEVREVYRATDIEFETSWFPIFYILDQRRVCSIQDMSVELGISHSAVSQLVSSLVKRELLTIQQTDDDQRRKEIRLSESGKNLLQRVRPLWAAFQNAFTRHLDPDLIPQLDAMEDLLFSGKIRETALNYLHRSKQSSVTELSLDKEEVLRFIGTHDLHIHPSMSCLGAFQQDELVGMLAYTGSNGQTLVHHIFVEPMFRRQGHARAMLQDLVSRFADNDLLIQKHNMPMLHLLSSLNHPFSVHP